MTTHLEDQTRPLVTPPASQPDFDFAHGAVRYLQRMGLDHAEIVKALVEELEFDPPTAETLASAA